MKQFHFYSNFFWITFMLILLNAQTYVFAQWSNNPNINTPVCTSTGDQNTPVSVSDGAGGVIITWADSRNGIDYDIYAQKLDSNGIPQWSINGAAICTTSGNQQYPVITKDSSGGAIIAWVDSRDATNKIFARRINRFGIPLWSSNGIQVSSGSGSPKIISDERGGALIAWDAGNYPTTFNV